jgi:hypothetical protein
VSVQVRGLRACEEFAGQVKLFTTEERCLVRLMLMPFGRISIKVHSFAQTLYPEDADQRRVDPGRWRLTDESDGHAR